MALRGQLVPHRQIFIFHFFLLLLDRQTFHFYPCYAWKAATTIFIKFTANQSLIGSNFKDLFSSTILYDLRIIPISNFSKYKNVIVESNLKDRSFVLSNDAFNFGDLLQFKIMKAFEVFPCSYFACLTII